MRDATSKVDPRWLLCPGVRWLGLSANVNTSDGRREDGRWPRVVWPASAPHAALAVGAVAWCALVQSAIFGDDAAIFRPFPSTEISSMRLRTLSLPLQVPGSYELPFGAKCLITSRAVQRPVDAVICIGCLIKGETMHFEYIAEAVTQV